MINNFLNFIERHWFILSCIFIFFTFIFSRYFILTTHFTHYDDIFPAYLIKVILNYELDYFSVQIDKYGNFLPDYLKEQLLLFLSNHPDIFTFIKRLIGGISVSLVSTYAPVQFFFTALFVNFNHSYEFSIFSWRLPSFLFSLFAFAAFIKFSSFFPEKNKIFLLPIGLTFLSTSWMFLIYSSQGANYPAGIFAIFLLLYLFQRIQQSEITIRKSIFIGIILSLLSLFHYQVLFFLPGFYLGYIFSSNISIFNRIIRILPAGIISIFATIFIYFVMMSHLHGHTPGVYWNAGPNGEYLWSFNNYESFKDSLSYIFTFFIINSLKVLYAILGFRESFDSISQIYAILIFIFCILGFIKISHQKIFRHLFIFILITIGVWIVLILNGNLTYSPTRHSLALIPIIIILFSFGLEYLFSILTNNKKIHLSAIIIFIATLHIGFITSFWQIYQSRIDPFQNEVNILELIEKYSVNGIAAYGYTNNLLFYPKINNSFETDWVNKHPFTNLSTKKDSNKELPSENYFMIICANSDLCGKKENEILALNEIKSKIESLNKSHELIYEYSSDSNITNGFSNFAGSGKRRIFIKIFSH